MTAGVPKRHSHFTANSAEASLETMNMNVATDANSSCGYPAFLCLSRGSQSQDPASTGGSRLPTSSKNSRTADVSSSSVLGKTTNELRT